MFINICWPCTLWIIKYEFLFLDFCSFLVIFTSFETSNIEVMYVFSGSVVLSRQRSENAKCLPKRWIYFVFTMSTANRRHPVLSWWHPMFSDHLRSLSTYNEVNRVPLDSHHLNQILVAEFRTFPNDALLCVPYIIMIIKIMILIIIIIKIIWIVLHRYVCFISVCLSDSNVCLDAHKNTN